MGVWVELFIFTSAFGFEIAGVFTVCTESETSGCAEIMTPLSKTVFSTNEKAPTEERGVGLYAVLQERNRRIESVPIENGGMRDDKNKFRHITDKNIHNKINKRADFKFMVITEVFFKKINSFLSIYIDF